MKPEKNIEKRRLFTRIRQGCPSPLELLTKSKKNPQTQLKGQKINRTVVAQPSLSNLPRSKGWLSSADLQVNIGRRYSN